MVRLVERIHAAGGATHTKVRDRRRAVARRVRNIAANLKLRNDDAKEKVRQINAELADLAETAAEEAVAVARNARRKLARSGDNASKTLACLVAELDTTMALTAAIVAQTRTRLGGEKPDGATRVVSLHDPDARPIAKGRLGKPVEFGYKAQIVDNADGVVVDHRVVIGNPPDAPMLAPAVARIKSLVTRAPRAVTADGIYGEASVEDELVAMGVKTVVIPPQGQAQRRPPAGPGPARVPQAGEVAHRGGGEDLAPQALLRLEPHAARRHRRSRDVVRARRVGSQRREDLVPARRQGQPAAPARRGDNGPPGGDRPTTTGETAGITVLLTRLLRPTRRDPHSKGGGEQDRKAAGGVGVGMSRPTGAARGRSRLTPTANFRFEVVRRLHNHAGLLLLTASLCLGLSVTSLPAPRPVLVSGAGLLAAALVGHIRALASSSICHCLTSSRSCYLRKGRGGG